VIHSDANHRVFYLRKSIASGTLYEDECSQGEPPMNRIDIKQNARKQLSANYWSVMYFTFLPSIIIGIAGVTYIGSILQLMDGKKMDLFVLHLSFIGWAILGLFTLNILNVFYTIPYMQLSTAGFYQELTKTI
jgi:uncharacterized membrane protein